VIAAVVHGDIDGLVSAAILYSYSRNRNERVKIYTSQPYLLPQALLRIQNLKRLRRLYIMDLGLDQQTWARMRHLMRLIAESVKTVWLDHHVTTVRLADELVDAGVSLVLSIDRCASTIAYHMFGRGSEDPSFFLKLARVGEVSDKVAPSGVEPEVVEAANKLVLALSENPSDEAFKMDLIRLWVLERRLINEEVEIRASIAARRLERLKKLALESVVYQSDSALIVDFRGVNATGYIGLLASQLAEEFKRTVFIVFNAQSELVVTSRAPQGVDVDLSTRLLGLASKYGGGGGGHPRAFSIRVPSAASDSVLRELMSHFP